MYSGEDEKRYAVIGGDGQAYTKEQMTLRVEMELALYRLAKIISEHKDEDIKVLITNKQVLSAYHRMQREKAVQNDMLDERLLSLISYTIDDVKYNTSLDSESRNAIDSIRRVEVSYRNPHTFYNELERTTFEKARYSYRSYDKGVRLMCGNDHCIVYDKEKLIYHHKREEVLMFDACYVESRNIVIVVPNNSPVYVVSTVDDKVLFTSKNIGTSYSNIQCIDNDSSILYLDDSRRMVKMDVSQSEGGAYGESVLHKNVDRYTKVGGVLYLLGSSSVKRCSEESIGEVSKTISIGDLLQSGEEVISLYVDDTVIMVGSVLGSPPPFYINSVYMIDINMDRVIRKVESINDMSPIRTVSSVMANNKRYYTMMSKSTVSVYCMYRDDIIYVHHVYDKSSRNSMMCTHYEDPGLVIVNDMNTIYNIRIVDIV